jgi:hypothetical protein
VFRIILPLWLLIVLSVVGGIFLVHFEFQDELNTNDSIMANFHTLELLDLNTTIGLLLKLPEKCFHDYLTTINITGSNLTLADVVEKGGDGAARTLADLDSSGLDFTEIVWLDVLSDFLKDDRGGCVDQAAKYANLILTARDKASIELAGQDLSFNWNRCWNISETGPLNTFHPTQKQIEAAANQSVFYEENWKQDQQRLKEEYKEEHVDDDSLKGDLENTLKATLGSIKNATGKASCEPNVAGTAWFWFTVMTTVGMR